jgi:hypothetical protein
MLLMKKPENGVLNLDVGHIIKTEVTVVPHPPSPPLVIEQTNVVALCASIPRLIRRKGVGRLPTPPTMYPVTLHPVHELRHLTAKTLRNDSTAPKKVLAWSWIITHADEEIGIFFLGSGSSLFRLRSLFLLRHFSCSLIQSMNRNTLTWG